MAEGTVRERSFGRLCAMTWLPTVMALSGALRRDAGAGGLYVAGPVVVGGGWEEGYLRGWGIFGAPRGSSLSLEATCHSATFHSHSGIRRLFLFKLVLFFFLISSTQLASEFKKIIKESNDQP